MPRGEIAAHSGSSRIPQRRSASKVSRVRHAVSVVGRAARSAQGIVYKTAPVPPPAATLPQMPADQLRSQAKEGNLTS